MIDGNMPHDQESINNLEALGKPMQEMYQKEREKYKRDEEDQRKLQEAMRLAQEEKIEEMLNYGKIDV